TFDGRPPRHFDSGLKPVKAPFPEIDTRVSLHDQYCFDSVLVVDAKPLDPASVVGGPVVASLAAAPNPVAATTEIAFAVSRAGGGRGAAEPTPAKLAARPRAAPAARPRASRAGGPARPPRRPSRPGPGRGPALRARARTGRPRAACTPRSRAAGSPRPAPAS